MSKIITTTREWWLIGLCLMLLLTQLMPSTIEAVYPVIDTVGSNMTNMQVDKQNYKCGETVKAYFLFQKQRNVVGTIQWKLVPSHSNARAYTYPARRAAAPAGIAAHWANVEPLPPECIPMEYHFEGTITYPLWFGSVSYPLRTTCFNVEMVK